MIDSGVYRMNFRGLSFGEALRLGGKAGFLPAMVLKLLGKKGSYLWLPPRDTERVCAREELSADAQSRLMPAVAELEGLGYRSGLFSRLAISLDPTYKDGASYRALHEDGRRLFYLAYLRRETCGPRGMARQDVVNPIGMFITEGGIGTVVLTNSQYLDGDGTSDVIQIDGAGPAAVAQRLAQELEKARWPVRRFASIEEAAAATTERDERAWAARIRRGLVARVPPEEESRVVVEARARLAAQK